MKHSLRLGFALLAIVACSEACTSPRPLAVGQSKPRVHVSSALEVAKRAPRQSLPAGAVAILGDSQLYQAFPTDTVWDRETLYTGGCLDVRAWDASTFELEGSWPTEGCAQVAVGGDTWAFGSGPSVGREPGVVEIRRVGDNHLVQRRVVPGRVTGLALSKNGTRLLVCGSGLWGEELTEPTDGFVHLVDTTTGKRLPLSGVPRSGRTSSPVVGCAMSGEGSTVLIAERHPDLNVDLPLVVIDDGRRHELECNSPDNLQVSLSGARLAASCAGASIVWDARSREVLLDLKTFTFDKSFHLDGFLLVGDDRLILSKDGDGFREVDFSVRVEDLVAEPRVPKKRASGRDWKFAASSLSRDGGLIASIAEGRLEIFRRGTFDKVAPLGKRHRKAVVAARFVSERRVVTADEHGWLRLWDADSGALVEERFFEQGVEQIVVLSADEVSVRSDGESWRWEPPTSKWGPSTNLHVFGPEHGDDSIDATLHGPPRTSCLRRTNNGGLADMRNKPLFDPAASWLNHDVCSTADDGSRVAIFSIEENSNWRLTDPLDEATFEKVRVLGTVDGREHASVSISAGAVALSPDGARLAVTASFSSSVENENAGQLTIYDAANGLILAERSAHGDRWLTDVAFSPSGNRLVTAGVDGGVIVWDTTELVSHSK